MSTRFTAFLNMVNIEKENVNLDFMFKYMDSTTLVTELPIWILQPLLQSSPTWILQAFVTALPKVDFHPNSLKKRSNRSESATIPSVILLEYSMGTTAVASLLSDDDRPKSDRQWFAETI